MALLLKTGSSTLYEISYATGKVFLNKTKKQITQSYQKEILVHDGQRSFSYAGMFLK
jgi:hypothetical protein